MLITVGRLKRAYWKQAQREYQERLQHYTDFGLVEVKDVVGQGLPDKAALKREGEQLLKAAESAARRIALTPVGVQMSSTQLATYLQRQVQLFRRLAFFIGGPLGFSDELLAACDEQLSLSTLTFPHELARIMFLEQLYRAATIISGEQYHK
jgi:23S rRNA (pseudouridine1915-N3)-methyltransferase